MFAGPCWADDAERGGGAATGTGSHAIVARDARATSKFPLLWADVVTVAISCDKERGLQ